VKYGGNEPSELTCILNSDWNMAGGEDDETINPYPLTMNHIGRFGAGRSTAHSELPKHKGRKSRWSLIRQKVD